MVETPHERFARWLAPAATAQLALLAAFTGTNSNLSLAGRTYVIGSVAGLASAAILITLSAFVAATGQDRNAPSRWADRTLIVALFSFFAGVVLNALFIALWLA